MLVFDVELLEIKPAADRPCRPSSRPRSPRRGAGSRGAIARARRRPDQRDLRGARRRRADRGAAAAAPDLRRRGQPRHRGGHGAPRRAGAGHAAARAHARRRRVDRARGPRVARADVDRRRHRARACRTRAGPRPAASWSGGSTARSPISRTTTRSRAPACTTPRRTSRGCAAHVAAGGGEPEAVALGREILDAARGAAGDAGRAAPALPRRSQDLEPAVRRRAPPPRGRLPRRSRHARPVDDGVRARRRDALVVQPARRGCRRA